MTSYKRNDVFGDLYIYNFDLKRGDLANPIDGRCCYTDPRFSPDNRYILFAFQDLAMGAQAETVFYYIPFATLNAGGEPLPLELSPLTNPKEQPQFALRPAVP